jgi:hypothetical protein
MKGLGEKVEAIIKNKPTNSITQKLSEKDDCFCEPVSEQDLE